MSLSIPSSEPQKFTAGDTVQWSRALTDFSAVDYALTYQLRGPMEQKITAATYQTSNFLVTLSAVATAQWKPGKYAIAGFVTDLATGLTRYVVKPRFPFIDVYPNAAALVEGAASNLSWAAVTLAAVEAAITKLSARTVSSASVNGQSYNLQDMGKLLSLRQRMKEEIAAEENAINNAAGLGGKKNILVRFTPLNYGYPNSVPGQIGPWQG